MRKDFDNFVNSLIKLSSAHSIEQEKPKAIITLGEEGSGKEVLALQAQDELSTRGGSILVGENYYKGFTENYISNSRENDIKASKGAINEAKYLSDKVLNYAIENKHNIVINENTDNVYNIKDVTDKLNSNGYEIELRAMATPHEHSLIRRNFQYEDQKGNIGFADHSGNKNFDEKSVETILSMSESEKSVSKVKVFDRVGNEVYANELNPDKQSWFKEPNAENTFKFETEKPLSQSEYQYNQVAWEQLVHMKTAAKAPKSEIDKVIAEKESIKEPKLKQEQENEQQLIVKSPDLYKGVQHGVVVNQNEDHVVMKINRFTAIKYDRDRLQDSNNEELEVGQQLFINHNGHGGYRVMEEKEAQQFHEQQEFSQTQNQQQDIEQDFGR